MKKHGVPETQPLGVLQWRSLIALNYAAKHAGVKRGMLTTEALNVCPNMMFAHVSTLIDKNGKDQIIGSSIMKVRKKESKDGDKPVWDVETRDQNFQKVSLHLYREESRKIFKIINRYSKNIEKAGTDEAFLDVTAEVSERYNSGEEVDYKENEGTKDFWEGAYFMSYAKDPETGIAKGAFVPETEKEKKLYLANKIAKSLRDDILNELGYKASAGISFNKTVAKIASSQNKPNA